ncbi:MAG TPA: phytanoyl-CoA dioxygenase family protein [Magnetospirillaceae bacterium]|nr:phytanoyl-CoA dioxygenase family protein [Magnetospirillaceae bacterium]
MDAITDLYPSRPSLVASILPRKDPVVYGGAVRSDGLLPETLERYREDGFLCFDSFLDASSLSELSEDVERLRAIAAPGDPVVLREPATDTVRAIYDVHKRSALIDALVRDEALLGPVRQILGGPVYVHQSRINYAAGPSAAAFYWHSDFETWHVEDGMPRMRAVNVQISLNDALPENGPLMLIPGSHLHYIPRLGEAAAERAQMSMSGTDSASLVGLIERNGIFTATHSAGTMVLFDCNMLHGSNGNITPQPRVTLNIVYNSVDNRPAAVPFGGDRPRPSFLAARGTAEEL